jgi:hypothetical protein
MTAWLTLASGLDRWEQDGGQWRLKEEGQHWLMVWPPDGPNASLGPFVILKPEIANWCFENIRAYRIVEHVPTGRFGPEEEDSWRIEFQHDGDMLLFKATWGEQ